MRAWIPLLMTMPALAEVAGTVQAQRAWDLPGLSYGMANDALGGGAGRNDDDFRTNALTAQVVTRLGIGVVIDHAIMTSKDQASRVDELSLTAAWLPWRTSRGWLAIGGGLRLRGDLGGESMQNHWHDWSDLARVDYLPYEDPPDDMVGTLTSSGAWAMPLPGTMTMPGLFAGRNALELSGRGLVAHDGTWQAAGDVVLAARGIDGAIWAGFRYEDGEVGTDSPTLVGVQAHERGPWLIYGMSVGSFFFQIGNNLHSGGGFGRLGFAHHRLRPDSDSGEAEVEGDLTYSPGPSMGVEFNWRPDAWQPPWGLGLGMHFGNARIAWSDNLVEFRQLALGPTWTQHLWQWGKVDLDGYAGLGLGLREDRVEIRGPVAPFAEESHLSAVGTGRAGLRILWGDHHAPEHTVRMGVGLGAAAWIPFNDATISNGVRTEVYATPDFRPEASLHVLARW